MAVRRSHFENMTSFGRPFQARSALMQPRTRTAQAFKFPKASRPRGRRAVGARLVRRLVRPGHPCRFNLNVYALPSTQASAIQTETPVALTPIVASGLIEATELPGRCSCDCAVNPTSTNAWVEGALRFPSSAARTVNLIRSLDRSFVHLSHMVRMDWGCGFYSEIDCGQRLELGASSWADSPAGGSLAEKRPIRLVRTAIRGMKRGISATLNRIRCGCSFRGRSVRMP